MKHVFLLSVILWFTSFAAIAGTEDYKLTPKDTIHDHCAFNKVKVLDVRANKEDLGFIKTGAFNSTQKLQPKNPELMFQQFAENICLQAKTQDQNTLIIALQNFRITDRAVGGEIGTFYARINFYLGNDNNYRNILSIDSFFETANGWDVTNAILKIADQKMTTWVIQAAKEGNLSKKDTVIKENEITVLYSQKSPYPIYNETPKNGIYLTEEDFLNNRPVECELMCAHDENSIVYRVYKKNEKGKFKIRIHDEPWFAAYSNGKWYKKNSLGVCKMDYSNNDFYFPEVGSGLRANDDMAIMFGMIGSAIANGSKGKVLYNMRYTPGTNSGKPVARLM